MPDVSLAGAKSAADRAPLGLTALPVQGLLEITCPEEIRFASELMALSPAIPALPAAGSGAAIGRAMKLAPDRWLFCSGAAPQTELEMAWSMSLRSIGGVAVEVSHGWRRFGIRGPGARDLLAKGMEIELRRKHFSAGDTRQTLFARVPAILHALTDDSFELLVATSYSDWAWLWLCDAAREFGFVQTIEETQR